VYISHWAEQSITNQRSIKATATVNMSNTSWTSPHNGSAVAGGGGGDDSWLKPDEPADAGEVLVLSAASSSSNHFSVQDGDPNDDAPAAEKSTGKKCGKSTVLFAFSSLFLAVFIIYSAVVQKNDDDSLLWLFFTPSTPRFRAPF
jgi:hypothetical protein